MSIRYGIGLSLEPVFTSRAYRARQLICGQYASWAAEMNMVYLTVAGFFQCPETEVAAVDKRLSAIAAGSQQKEAQFPLSHQGIGASTVETGHIYLDFATPGGQPALDTLIGTVADMLKATMGVATELPESGVAYQPHLPLMQYASLPSAVFDDAVEFARAVVADLQVPFETRAWRLLLLRFESAAAGDDWGGGKWAADLRWDLLASHPL